MSYFIININLCFVPACKPNRNLKKMKRKIYRKNMNDKNLDRIFSFWYYLNFDNPNLWKLGLILLDEKFKCWILYSIKKVIWMKVGVWLKASANACSTDKLFDLEFGFPFLFSYIVQLAHLYFNHVI